MCSICKQLVELPSALELPSEGELTALHIITTCTAQHSTNSGSSDLDSGPIVRVGA